jgi:hypothetical protein
MASTDGLEVTREKALRVSKDAVVDAKTRRESVIALPCTWLGCSALTSLGGSRKPR